MFMYIFLNSFFVMAIFLLHVLVIYNIAQLYNKRDQLILKDLIITLLKCFGIYFVALIAFIFISSTLYQITYVISFTYLAYLLYVYFFSLIHKSITRYTSMSFLYSQIFVFIIPLMILIFSLINAQVTKYQEVTIIYPGYNDSLKIMQISDIHLGGVHQKGSIENIVKIINETKPDVVAITGDISDGSSTVQAEWLEPFNQVSKDTEVLYITGNHEDLYGRDEIIDTINKVEKINHIGDKDEILRVKGVSIIGIDYKYSDVKERVKTLINKFGVNVDTEPTVLLSHIPNCSLKEYKEMGIYLALAGHTHGGQWFPLSILSYLTSKYFCGLYKDENSNYLFVSIGYGTGLFPIRNFSQRTIALITLKGN